MTFVFTRFLSLTLSPLRISDKYIRWGLIAAIIALGVMIAWLPVKLTALVLLGAVFLVLLLRWPLISVYLLIPVIPFSSLLAMSIGGFNVGLMEMLLAAGLVAWLLQAATQADYPQTSPAISTVRSLPPLTLPLLIFLGSVSLSWLNALSIGAALVETIKWVEVLALYWLMTTLLLRHQIKSATSSPHSDLPKEREVSRFSPRWAELQGGLLKDLHVRCIVVTLLLAGCAQAVLGLYQFVFRAGPEGFLLFGGRFLRAYGTFAQPNPYAGYLGLILPLALALTLWALSQLISTKSSSSRVVHLSTFLLTGLSLGLLVAALFASQSRAGWLSFGAAALVTLIVYSKRPGMLLTGLVLAGSLLFLTNSVDLSITSTTPTNTTYGIILQRFVDALDIITITDISTLEVTDANFATVERLAHWQAAREMWRDNVWLGVGFGNYAVVYPAYAVGRWLDPLGHAHNYLLNLGAETGLAGIIGYLIFWISTLTVSYLAVRRSRGFDRAAAAGGVGILVHLQIHNLFDNLYVQGMYLHIAIILSLISTIYLWKKRDSHQ